MVSYLRHRYRDNSTDNLSISLIMLDGRSCPVSGRPDKEPVTTLHLILNVCSSLMTSYFSSPVESTGEQCKGEMCNITVTYPRDTRHQGGPVTTLPISISFPPLLEKNPLLSPESFDGRSRICNPSFQKIIHQINQ